MIDEAADETVFPDDLITLADLFPFILNTTPLENLLSDATTLAWFDDAGFAVWSDISCMALDEIAGWPGFDPQRVDQLMRDLAGASKARVGGSFASQGEPPPAKLESNGEPKPATREQLMIQLREEGASLRAIGEKFGVTHERVRQILSKNGGPTRAEVRAKRAQRAVEQAHARRQIVDDAVRPALLANGAMSVQELSQATGTAETDLAEFWPQDLEHLRIWPAGRSDQTWSDEAIFAAIREAALYEFPLTAKAYAELVRVGQVQGPSLPRVHQRFGGWAAACVEAGVEHGQTPRASYNSRWTDEELIAFARDYFLDPAWPNSAHRFDEWRSVNAVEAPSFQTLRNRFGTWSNVKRLALRPGDFVHE